MTDCTNKKLKSQTDLFTEISDEQSEVTTGGALAIFRDKKVGSDIFRGATPLGNYTTTSDFDDISVRLWGHEKNIIVTASGTSSSGEYFEWSNEIKAFDQQVIHIATGVKDGTAFELTADAEGGEHINMNMTY